MVLYLNMILLDHVKLHIQAETDCLCFYKNSTNQTFTPISSNIVYFKGHLTYKV